jgi:hypothetical protein
MLITCKDIFSTYFILWQEYVPWIQMWMKNGEFIKTNRNILILNLRILSVGYTLTKLYCFIHIYNNRNDVHRPSFSLKSYVFKLTLLLITVSKTKPQNSVFLFGIKFSISIWNKKETMLSFHCVHAHICACVCI